VREDLTREPEIQAAGARRWTTVVRLKRIRRARMTIGRIDHSPNIVLVHAAWVITVEAADGGLGIDGARAT
jgi:hypothetical protein